MKCTLMMRNDAQPRLCKRVEIRSKRHAGMGAGHIRPQTAERHSACHGHRGQHQSPLNPEPGIQRGHDPVREDRPAAGGQKAPMRRPLNPRTAQPKGRSTKAASNRLKLLRILAAFSQTFAGQSNRSILNNRTSALPSGNSQILFFYRRELSPVRLSLKPNSPVILFCAAHFEFSQSSEPTESSERLFSRDVDVASDAICCNF